MSVLVKDMTMPEDCPICPLSYWNAGGSFTGCALKKRFFSDEEMRSDSKPDFCPLIEVPAPHGRLIDVDAFSEEMKKRHKAASDWYDSVEDNEMLARAESTMMAFTECRLTLDAMQTIIEAEEET